MNRSHKVTHENPGSPRPPARNDGQAMGCFFILLMFAAVAVAAFALGWVTGYWCAR